MVKRLLQTIPLEDGELFCVNGGRCILLASCQARAEIYEYRTSVPTLREKSAQIKRRGVTIVLCSDLEPTRALDEVFLRKVSRFELQADIQRRDGVFESIRFDPLTVEEIDLFGTWTFTLEDQKLTEKLLSI